MKKYYSDILDELLDNISDVEYKKTELKMMIAANIDKALKSKKIRKSEFALMIKKPPSVVSRWLSGSHNFTIDTIAEINEVLKTNVIKNN